MSLQLELRNVNLRAGDQLKVKGLILHDAERFQIDLGCDADDLALHFNPRFHDDADGAVLVCNSKTAGCWGEEKRDIHNPLQRGTDVKPDSHIKDLRPSGFPVSCLSFPPAPTVCNTGRAGSTIGVGVYTCITGALDSGTEVSGSSCFQARGGEIQLVGLSISPASCVIASDSSQFDDTDDSHYMADV